MAVIPLGPSKPPEEMTDEDWEAYRLYLLRIQAMNRDGYHQALGMLIMLAVGLAAFGVLALLGLLGYGWLA